MTFVKLVLGQMVRDDYDDDWSLSPKFLQWCRDNLKGSFYFDFYRTADNCSSWTRYDHRCWLLNIDEEDAMLVLLNFDGTEIVSLDDPLVLDQNLRHLTAAET